MVSGHLGKSYETEDPVLTRGGIDSIDSPTLRLETAKAERKRVYSELTGLVDRAVAFLDHYIQRPVAIEANAGNIKELGFLLMRAEQKYKKHLAALAAYERSESGKRLTPAELVALRNAYTLGGFLHRISLYHLPLSATALREAGDWRANSLQTAPRHDYELKDESHLSEGVLDAELASLNAIVQNADPKNLSQLMQLGQDPETGEPTVGFVFGDVGYDEGCEESPEEEIDVDIPAANSPIEVFSEDDDTEEIKGARK